MLKNLTTVGPRRSSSHVKYCIGMATSSKKKNLEELRVERNQKSILGLIPIGRIETPFLEKNGNNNTIFCLLFVCYLFFVAVVV
jgi:hypothetical protein